MPNDDAIGCAVLIAEDDPGVHRLFRRLLETSGYSVDTAEDGDAARALIDQRRYDVILSDITMPGLTGIDLLRVVREQDLDVPVILVTGDPNLDTAVQAVQYGALRYLVKPVKPEALLDVVAYATRISRLARIRREALDQLDHESSASDRAGLETAFERALDGLWMAYQPIVQWSHRRAYAFEALLRSEEPSLSHPGALLDAAERLNRLPELGRRIRELVSRRIGTSDTSRLWFINLHPRDLLDETLYSPLASLSSYAERVVLEITERAHLDCIPDLSHRLAKLRELGFRFALDDLGAGYAGLSSFVQMTPEVVKIDMSLVQGIDGNSVKTRLVRSIVDVCLEMGIGVVAEGVETEDDRRVLVAIGVELLQGYLFAKPCREPSDLSPSVFEIDGQAALV